MSENAISVANVLDGVVSKYDDDAFSDMSKGGSFLPRIQLMTAASGKVKEGDFPANHYALINGKDHTDLGKEVDLLILAWRPTAMDYGAEEFIITHDRDGDVYKDIQNRADNVQNSNCSWGPEFLVYVPGQGYATFFMGSKSARNEAATIKGYMHKACTLSSKKIEGKKFTWFCPEGKACQTPFDPPARDELLEQINKFEDPPKAEEKEMVKEGETSEGRER
jgi:hypothetical protein